MTLEALKHAPCFRWIPLLTPAVKTGLREYTADQNLISLRIKIVARSALACLATSLPLAYRFRPALALLPLAASSIPILFFDLLKTDDAINKKAVKDWMEIPHPPKEAKQRIASSVRAAHLLVQSGGDLKKRDEEGFTLLGERINWESAKILLDHGADPRAPEPDGDSWLDIRLQMGEGSLFEQELDYVLRLGKITPDTLSADEQVALWTKIRHRKTGQLLKQFGFNPNKADAHGCTPLLKVVREASALSKQEENSMKAYYLEKTLSALLTFQPSTEVRAQAKWECTHPRLKALL